MSKINQLCMMRTRGSLVHYKDGGYALGIIVRGSFRTKGGLGFFFGPRYVEIPDSNVIWMK
jgi:hypothetical protein